MTLKKYIGDKNFYKMVLTIAVPIMVQNGVSNFVNLLDNLMIGRIGTNALSGVAIANQIMFVFLLVLLLLDLILHMIQNRLLLLGLLVTYQGQVPYEKERL